MLIERILIVGLGSIGRRHLRLAREILPRAKVAVLRHKPDQDKPDAVDYSFSTMDQALAFAPQIAVIANPPSYHLSVAIPLAMAGVHLLIEKPLAASANGVAELLKICNVAKIQLVTGYNLRYLPSLRRFKSLLEDNIIGAVWSVRCEVGQSLLNWRPDTDYKLGVSARRSLGGGALSELSHELDYLLWIFGDAVWVQAALFKQSDLEIDVEDCAHLIIGLLGKEDENQIIAAVNMDFVRHDTTRLCTAIGKLGSLRWNGLSGTVELFKTNTQSWIEVFRHEAVRDESYRSEWKAFLSSVEGSARPLISAEEGLKVLEIIDAVRLAAETKTRVDINS